jgi:cysteinyl-tRNA synthetase
MIEMIEVLLKKGIAYKGGDGSIYYAIRKFPRYGCLSHLHLDELQAGASDRVAADEYDKDHASDFVLWKKYDEARDGAIYWESPFGKGRPGWHLECSAMAISLLGETLDIHVGGVDNMFPHHENEIAQSEAYSDKLFVKLWMHSEHLLVDGQKMSKSQGNFYTLRDLLQRGFTGRQVRYMLLHTHYRTQLNFTLPGLESIKHSLQRLDDFVLRLHETRGEAEGERATSFIKQADLAFSEALADDLNISAALAALFDLVREMNTLSDAGQLSATHAQEVLKLLQRFNQVLSFLHLERADTTIPKELQEALEKRLEARREKNWALADTLRDQIYNNGYIIEDTPAGARLKKVGK